MLELARADIGEEVRKMLRALYVSDFTMPELVAVAAVIRPVWERAEEMSREPAPVVKLRSVRPENAKDSRRAEKA